tara:strand:+ start:232 stop:1323 length:1092 start_codon:yes stop_codon:yes gene_type:complete
MRKLLLGLAFSLLASAALAAETPAVAVKAAAAPADMMQAGTWYVTGDAAWEGVNLPDYNLGFHKVTNPSFFDGGTFQTFSQHLDGYRLQGAAGYFLPASYASTLMGSNTRVEFGVLYSRATGDASGRDVFTDGGIVTQTIDGAGAGGGYVCSPGQVCVTTSDLSTTYSDWKLNGKIAGDYRVDVFLLTPSLALFGGETQTDQLISQLTLLGAHPERLTYTADTSLRSRDFGVRGGVDLKYDLAPQVTLGLGASAGLATRHASFDGTDLATDALFGFLTGASTVSGSDNATPIVANTEVSVAYKWFPALTVRGFAGLNYDSKVAGIEAASFGGTVGGVTSRTPAHITFHSEIGYYVGSGVAWSF